MKKEFPIEFPKDKEAIRAIMHDALLSSYKFWNDKLDGPLRKESDMSFNEAMELCLTSMSKWTCLHRPAFSSAVREHWEFGAVSFGSPSHYIWVLVRPDKAEEIFKKHNLKPF